MSDYLATGVACSNIAFIKYWGNTDNSLHLPSNSSLSMTLDSLKTITSVYFDPQLSHDTLEINQQTQLGETLTRVQNFMDQIRHFTNSNLFARITSETNFPLSAGLASSASGYAALTKAAISALHVSVSESELSALARLGSGSAARSIPGGFVEWHSASAHAESFAESIAGPYYWDLTDVIAIVQKEPKKTGSSTGHILSASSPFQSIRLESSPSRLKNCRTAIFDRDFVRLAEVIELDSMMMHSVMMTSNPPLFYWEPATLFILKAVQEWRKQGLQVCATVDAGANPHLICPANYTQQVKEKLAQISSVQSILVSATGGPARLISS